MAIVRQATGIDGNTSTLTATWPVATLTGSFLVGVYTQSSSLGTPTAPAGWTQLGATQAGGQGSLNFLIYTAANAASQTTTAWTGIGASPFCGVCVAEVLNLNTVATQTGSFVSNSIASSTVAGQLAISAFGPVTTQCAVFLAGVWGAAHQITNITGTGWTFLAGSGQNGDTDDGLAWQDGVMNGTTLPAENITGAGSSMATGHFIDAIQFALVETPTGQFVPQRMPLGA